VHVVGNFGGSLQGIRDLLNPDQPPGGLAALSDGAATVATPGMTKQQLAVIVYGVVVNKSVGIDDLSLANLQQIYLGKITNWKPLGGPDLPIRLVGRDGKSGSRTTFEQWVLHGTEGELSSDDCYTRDHPTERGTIRCEVSTTEDLVHTVSTVPGAIGYADVANTATRTAVRGGDLITVKLDGRYPETGSLPDYPFWTVEYLYTRTAPSAPLQGLVDYLAGDAARNALFEAGYPACLNRTGELNHLCTLR
jgi:ABC-type phosphate transport system substrate-binding protein